MQERKGQELNLETHLKKFLESLIEFLSASLVSVCCVEIHLDPLLLGGVALQDRSDQPG